MVVLVAAGALVGPSVLGLVSNPLSGVVGTQLLFNMFDHLKLRPKVAQTVVAESAFNDVTGTVLTLTLVGLVEAGGFTFSGSGVLALGGSRALRSQSPWSPLPSASLSSCKQRQQPTSPAVSAC
jgi:hypothetical protein